MTTSRLKSDANDSSQRWPDSVSPRELAELERDAMSLSPATFAEMASAGKWQSAPHLMHLDRMLMADEMLRVARERGLAERDRRSPMLRETCGQAIGGVRRPAPNGMRARMSLRALQCSA